MRVYNWGTTLTLLELTFGVELDLNLHSKNLRWYKKISTKHKVIWEYLPFLNERPTNEMQNMKIIVSYSLYYVFKQV